jgi:hypothetical protein
VIELRFAVAAHARGNAHIAEHVQRRARRDQRTGHRARALARRRRGHGLRVLVIEAGDVERVLRIDDPVGRGHAVIGQVDAFEHFADRAARPLEATAGRRIVEVVGRVRGGHVGERRTGRDPRERRLATARIRHRAVARREQVEILDQRRRVGGRDGQRLEQSAGEADGDEPLVQARAERGLFGEPDLRGLRFPRAGGRGGEHDHHNGPALHGVIPPPPSPTGTRFLSLL